MTTGVTGVYDTNNMDYKTWTGGDGRYVTVYGSKIDKWNAYSMNRFRHISQASDAPWNQYCQPGPSSAEEYVTANDTLKIYSKLASKARNHDFDLGNFVAEGKQAYSMIVGACRTVGGALVDVKRGKLSSAARRLGVSKHTSKLSVKDVAGRWLELQYGWLPLLSDAYEAGLALEAITAPPRVKEVYCGSLREGNSSTSASPTLFTLNSLWRVKCKLQYRWVEQLTAARSLGLEDPLGIAWEVIPYSFVVDWFLPVSTYLDVLNTIPKLKGEWCRTDVRTRLCYGVKNIAYPERYKNAQTYWNDTYVDRTVGTTISNISIPLPNVRPLSDAMSPLHIKNAIALVTQQLSGTPKN